MAKSQLRIGAVLSYINIIVGALKYIFYDSIIFFDLFKQTSFTSSVTSYHRQI